MACKLSLTGLATQPQQPSVQLNIRTGLSTEPVQQCSKTSPGGFPLKPPPATKLVTACSAKILERIQARATAQQADSNAVLPGDAKDEVFNSVHVSTSATTVCAGGIGKESRDAIKQETPLEDDDENFMKSWRGLFSQKSPLVNGTLEDPFAEVEERAHHRPKIEWKKNKERPGHHARYQTRRYAKKTPHHRLFPGTEAEDAQSPADPKDLPWLLQALDPRDGESSYQ
eukprot:TRINITY_DN12392_c0_g1_i1.p1 TRINITY_DN12392_c0_g1~~TRINITY_DN12392_c0_g1_i1.p1  ORF type:complete len:228 (-),score=47.39 TRINITY_DN12392_c0_g1_i1:100-783(-)